MGRPTNHPHIVGLGEVAARCGVSRSTVNRNRAKLEENGAWKDEAGAWHVPVSALLGLGWDPRPAEAGTSHDTPDDVPVTHPGGASDTSHELAELRAELADVERRRVVAEAEADKWRAIAAERSLSLEDLRRTLRLLEAPATRSAEPEAVRAETPASSDPPRAGGLLGRFRRR